MSSTSITVQINQQRPELVARKRVNIPTIDAIAHDWFDAQLDVSTSLRMLIHDEVKTHGVVDRIVRHGATGDSRDQTIADLRARLAAYESQGSPISVSLLAH